MFFPRPTLWAHHFRVYSVGAIEDFQEVLVTKVVGAFSNIEDEANAEAKRVHSELASAPDLTTWIGVSRTTIRAGLQSLAAKGVLVTRHGAGTFVADGPMVLDSEPLGLLAALHGFTRHEMFEARRTLEVGVAGLAAERARGEQLAAIADEVTGMFAALDDPQALLVHDIRFHRAVATASGNPLLAALVEMVSALFYELRRDTAGRARDLRPIADTHRQIISPS